MNKDILTLMELSKQDFDKLFNRAIHLKAAMKQADIHKPLMGKTLGLIFDKP